MLGKPAATANTQRCLYCAESGDGLSHGIEMERQRKSGGNKFCAAQTFDEGECRVWPLLSVDFKLTLAARDNLYTQGGGGNTVKSVGLRRTCECRCLTPLRSYRGRTALRVSCHEWTPLVSHLNIRRSPPAPALYELVLGKQPRLVLQTQRRNVSMKKEATRRL